MGSKAKFHSAEGWVELEVYQHSVSEYFNAARNCGFDLVELEEWWDDANTQEVPRLLTMVLMKRS